METLEIHDFEWVVPCTYCTKMMNLVRNFPVTDGDLIRCPHCNKLQKIKVML